MGTVYPEKLGKGLMQKKHPFSARNKPKPPPPKHIYTEPCENQHRPDIGTVRATY